MSPASSKQNLYNARLCRNRALLHRKADRTRVLACVARERQHDDADETSRVYYGALSTGKHIDGLNLAKTW